MKPLDNREEEIKQSLITALQSNSLPHALLFTGGTAKKRRELAKFAAALRLCSGGGAPCKKCSPCKKIAKDLHPDVYVITTPPKRSHILKEQADLIVSRCAVKPNDGDYSVFIIDPAEEMTAEASNKLLKTIEEPPAPSLFIFCAENKESILPTILSRVSVYSLGAGAQERLDKKSTEAAALLCRALAQRNEYEIIRATAPLEKNRKATAKCCERLKIVLRDAMRGESENPLSQMPEEAALLKAQLSLNELLNIYSILDKTITATLRNANETVLLCTLCSRLGQAVKK